ncbi:GNAT family N-acetyltransferase [Halobacteriales archaeon Cl-PHB]
MARVRDGTAADLPALRAIQTATLAEPWPELLQTALEGGEAGPTVVVLETTDPIGYALVVADAEDVAYVPEFAVHPDHQGEGFGTELMEGLCDRLAAAGYQRLRLTVQVTDQRARAFYDGRGFSVVERLAGHFETGDGLLLERQLE